MMNKKRLLALLLVLCMVIGTAPLSAFAENEASGNEALTIDHPDIHTTKSVTKIDDYHYKLRLESFLEGDPTTKERIPSDIILVLDQSTSMSFCMNCGKDIDVRSILELHNTYYVYPTIDDDGKGTGDRIPVYYCAGNKANPSLKCGHSMGGWFDKPHTTETTSQGTRYVPSIANGAYHKLQNGTNKNYNVYARRFYTAQTGGSTIKLWIESSKEITSSTSVYRKTSGGEFKQLVYCSDHAAWHDADVTCDKSNDKDHGTEFFVPTATVDEYTLGTTRFYYDADGKDGVNCTCTTGNRYQALITALNEFTSSIYNYSTANNVDNRIALVGFASGDYNRLLSVPQSGSTAVLPISSTSATVDNYKNSLQDVSTTRGQTVINNGISKILDQGGGTQTATGLEMAKNIFDNNDKLLEGETKRNRIVIVFTDGRPEQTISGDSYGGADTALSHSYNLREDGVTVYSIGVFGGANSDDLSSVSAETVVSSSGYLNNNSSANKFMHLLCNNYTGSSKPTLANTYSAASLKTGYYFSASNPKGLQDAFYKIAEDINNGSSENFDASTVLRDVITPYFKLDSTSEVTMHTEKCTGSTNGEYTFEDDNNTTIDNKLEIVPASDPQYVDVKGFNYADYYVAIDDVYGTPTPRGRKLVVEIPIVVNPDFLGGDDVNTNLFTSGIYLPDQSDPIETFLVPNVDVPVRTIVPNFQNGAIYVSQQAAIPHVANIGKFSVNGTTYTIDGTNNAYVDIVYTISDQDNNQISYTVPAGTKESDLKHLLPDSWTGTGIDLYKVLTDDTNYFIKCEVISVNNSDGNKSEASGDATIYVYKPHVTFKDSIMNYGGTADYDQNNYVSIVWRNGDNTAGAEGNTHNDLLGTAPELLYEFAPAEGVITEETSVKVTSVVSPTNTHLNHKVTDNTEIISYTTFHREACTHCSYEGAVCGEQCIKVETDECNFMLHLNTFDLTITKEVAGNYVDPGQSFLFRITGPNGFSMDVDIQGQGSVTVKNLVAGEYTVTELVDWSWRYELVGNEEGIVITPLNHEADFKNERKNPYWLSGEAFCENLFDGTN